MLQMSSRATHVERYRCRHGPASGHGNGSTSFSKAIARKLKICGAGRRKEEEEEEEEEEGEGPKDREERGEQGKVNARRISERGWSWPALGPRMGGDLVALNSSREKHAR